MYYKFKIVLSLGYINFEQKDTLKHCLQFVTFNKSNHYEGLMSVDYINTTMREDLSVTDINLLATYFKVTFQENFTLLIEEK